MAILAKDNNISLKEHTNDLLNAFNALSSKISDNDLRTCIKYAILLHDIGKVLPYFQIRYLKNEHYKPYEITVDIYHSLLSVLFIDQEKLHKKIGDDLTFVLSAIAYHHWKNKLEYLLRFGSTSFEDFKNKLENYIKDLENNLRAEFDNSSEIKSFIKFNNYMLNGLINGISFADYIVPPYQFYWMPKRIEIDEAKKKKWVLISGFLQRCDHFASYCEEENESELKIDIDAISKLEIKKNIINTLNIKENELWQYKTLYPTKNKITYEDNLILIAPTGSGKTEFAFLWSNGDKFFYTLPLRAAVEQIFERAKKIFGEDNTGLLHSDADVYLIKDDNDIEKTKTYEIAKQLSYPVIVSTGDQFFPYGLRPPGYEKIYATFSYSKLVIDEVQSYDPKAAAIIVKFIEDITRLGGKFLLMTATLPEYVKTEIAERVKGIPLSVLDLYDTQKQQYENLKKHKIEFIKVLNQTKDFSFTKDIINDIVFKAQDKRVLVILNTIKQAKYVYEQIIKVNQELEKNNKTKLVKDEIILFHSQFTINEKQKIKDAIETKFKNPKDAADNEGKILVATQVIEAAIDIDADVLYTEIAPMDALVQRMGRVLRRFKENCSLKEKEEPNIYIIFFENGYESGNGRVYDKELIEKTLIVFDTIKKLKSLSIENYYKRKKEFQIENLQLNNSILLSEYKKYELVNKLYKIIDPDGKYLSDFYTTLDILDAGFMSDRKEEAQRIFREIINIAVVDESRKIDFINKLNEFCQNNKNFNYTLFKKEIIANFVLNIPYYQFTYSKLFKIANWIQELDLEDNTKKKKLLRWTDDLWVAFFKNIDDYSNTSRSNII